MKVRFCGPVENLSEDELREELTALESKMTARSWNGNDADRIQRIRAALRKMESIKSGKGWRD